MNDVYDDQLPVGLPFAAQQNPHSAAAQRSTREWASGFGLLGSSRVLERFDALGYGRLTAYACPTSELATLQLVADWFTLFFVFDDIQGDALASSRITQYESLRRVLLQVIWDRGRQAVGHPVASALADLCRRTFPGRSPAWAHRFELHLEVWLTGQARENGYRCAGATPGIHEYTGMRRDASTVYPIVDLMEVAEGVEVPEHVYYGSDYQTLVTGTADITCWINDIHSLAVEVAAHDPINLVSVLCEDRRIPSPQAVAEVRQMISARVEDHLAAARSLAAGLAATGLPVGVREGIERCVRDQMSVAAGMEVWDRTDTVRFHTAERSGAEHRSRNSADLLSHGVPP
jgi:hypothetical protein